MAEGHGFDGMIIGEHSEYNLHERLQRGRQQRARLDLKAAWLLGGTVVYGEVVSGLQQVHRHCCAHVSQANESNFHDFSLLILLICRG